MAALISFSDKALAQWPKRCLIGGALSMAWMWMVFAFLTHWKADMENELPAVTTVGQLQPQTAGISLMQSGRSVLPAAQQMALGGVTFRDSLEDTLATLEDEFDDSIAHPQVAPSSWEAAVSIPHSRSGMMRLGDFRSHAVAVFIIICLFMTSSFRRSRSKLKSKTVDDVAPATPQASDCAPVGKGFAALEEAVRLGDEASCLRLLQHGGRWAVRQEDACGCTALHIAAHHGSLAMAKLLLDNGAKVDAREAWEETPLHMAARTGSVEVCELLLSRGADIDATNSHGWTPLLAAGHARKEAVCEFLLSRDAGAGGVSDAALPPLVNTMIFRRIFAGGSQFKDEASMDEHTADAAKNGDSAEYSASSDPLSPMLSSADYTATEF